MDNDRLRSPLALTAQINRHLDQRQLELSPAAQDALEFVSHLLNAISKDSMVDPGIKVRLGRLTLPILKVAFLDDSFFSSDSHPARELVNRLGNMALPTAGKSEAENKFDAILTQLTDSDMGRESFATALKDIDHLLEMQEQTFQARAQKVIEDRDAQCLLIRRLAGTKPALPKATQTAQPNNAIAASWTRMLDRVSRLGQGAQVVLDAHTPRARRAVLAWIDDERETFVFVDAAGSSSVSFTQQELTMALHRQSMIVDDHVALPLMERGICQMLRDVHDRLERIATRDPLTGLMKPKQFQQHIESAITNKRVDFLAVIEIDRFEAIQAKCGSQANDALITEVANLIERQVADQGRCF